MARRTERMAEDAARQASEAGRVLQQRQQETKAEVAQTVEPQVTEPPAEERTERTEPIPRVKARNEQRRLAVEEVENAYQKRLEDQMKQPGIQPQEEATAQETTPGAQGDDTSAAATGQDTVTGATDAVPAVEMVKVKVDGEEFEVPKAEVDAHGGVATYQIMKAADKKLAEAKGIFAEARKMQDGAVSQALRVLQQPQTPQVPPATAALQKLAATRFGTDEEFVAAMQEYNAAVTPKQDPNALISQAVIHMSRQTATNAFKQEFADVVTNPLLLKLAATLENERIQQISQDPAQLIQFDWSAFYRKIGNEVRSVAAPRPHQSQPNAGATPSTTTSQTSQPSEKEARKASIVNLPTTAAARATPPAEEKPMTYEQARVQALLDVAKARGKHLA